MKWDLLVIFLALYNCVMIPMNLAFHDDVSKIFGLNVFERVVDVIFILDIILNFRTTYVNPKTNLEIVDPMKVAMNYVNSIRFPVDVFASIPFEAFVSLTSTADSSEDSGSSLNL